MFYEKYQVSHEHGIRILYKVASRSRDFRKFIEECESGSGEFKDLVKSWDNNQVKAMLQRLSGIIANDCVGLDKATQVHFANMALYKNGGILNGFAIEFKFRPVEIVELSVHDYCQKLDWSIASTK